MWSAQFETMVNSDKYGTSKVRLPRNRCGIDDQVSQWRRFLEKVDPTGWRYSLPFSGIMP